MRTQFAGGAVQNNSLLNGPEYVRYNRSYIKGHQYFGPDDEQLGNIRYDGAMYANVPMRYDTHLGLLVLSYPNTGFKFRLDTERISCFTLGEHSFVRLIADTVQSSVIRTGFYEVLLDDKLKLLARRYKNLQVHAAARSSEGEFIEMSEFVILHKGKYIKVNKKGKIFNMARDKRKLLNQFVRDNQLKFNKAGKEEFIVRVIAYYNSLI